MYVQVCPTYYSTSYYNDLYYFPHILEYSLTTHMQYVGQLNTFSYAVLSPYTLQTLSLLASLKFVWNIILFSVG